MKRFAGRALDYLESALDDARRRNLLRDRPEPIGDPALSFSSNDYLGLAHRPVREVSAGAGASRLVVGEHVEHLRLEAASADWVGQEAALAFTSGYTANIGVLAALAGAEDVIVSDERNHASIVDGARLSRARIAIVPHLDTAAVDRSLMDTPFRRAFVVTESYFSMDADSPDLAALRAICDARGAALIVDEAHALGVLGPGGHGLCAAAGVVADAIMGTYGKAFGAAGAFVAGRRVLTEWLWNRARSFVFSTGMSPAVAAAALDGMKVAATEPARRERALAAAGELRVGLRRLGIAPLGDGPIVPWVLGEAADAVAMAERLRAFGLSVRPIRPPTVPAGTSRIRMTVTAAHSPDDIDRALDVVARAISS